MIEPNPDQFEQFVQIVEKEGDRARVLIQQYFGESVPHFKSVIRLAILESALEEFRPSLLKDNEAVELYKHIRQATTIVVVTKEE